MNTDFEQKDAKDTKGSYAPHAQEIPHEEILHGFEGVGHKDQGDVDGLDQVRVYTQALQDEDHRTGAEGVNDEHNEAGPEDPPQARGAAPRRFRWRVFGHGGLRGVNHGWTRMNTDFK